MKTFSIFEPQIENTMLIKKHVSFQLASGLHIVEAHNNYSQSCGKAIMAHEREELDRVYTVIFPVAYLQNLSKSPIPWILRPS